MQFGAVEATVSAALGSISALYLRTTLLGARSAAIGVGRTLRVVGCSRGKGDIHLETSLQAQSNSRLLLSPSSVAVLYTLHGGTRCAASIPAVAIRRTRWVDRWQRDASIAVWLRSSWRLGMIVELIGELSINVGVIGIQSAKVLMHDLHLGFEHLILLLGVAGELDLSLQACNFVLEAALLLLRTSNVIDC
jgi:hypothetical protein